MERGPILEEFIEYRIYPLITKNHEPDSYFESLCKEILDTVKGLSNTYIWHNEGFSLNFSKSEACLKGKVIFGDGIEDEWFITYMFLDHISVKFPELIIKVIDGDGEFLLIEAAEFLPDWLEPETSENRVFLHNGNVHIINIEDILKPSLNEALSFIRKFPNKSIATKEIQGSVRRKSLSCKLQNLHNARVTLPRRVAATIQQNDQNITSKICHSFNYHDPSQMTRASRLGNSRDKEGNLDFVSIRIPFTRTHFAHLLCSNVQAPKGYPMPPESSLDYLSFSLGLKLALGLEFYFLNLPLNNSTCEESPMTRLEERDPPISEYFGPDDDLNWLNIPEGDIMNDIDTNLKGVSLNEGDVDEILQKMLNEEENPSSINDRLTKFLDLASGFEGISTSLSDSESDSSSFSDEDFEEGEEDEFLEKEILETLRHDPDLLMRLLEKGFELGFDSEELLGKVKSFKLPTGEKSHPQKGIADIDPVKLAEARKTRRSAVNEGKRGEDRESQESSSSSYEENVYDGEELASQARDKNLKVSPIDEPDIITQMDQELSLTLIDHECVVNPQIEILNAAKADNSPAHAILLSI